MKRIFIGYDKRQPIAYHVLCQSILENASVPVAITPLVLETLPIERRGLTDFTFSRYLVPYLCGYEGEAIFMDSDMLVLGDVAELSTDHPVSVVKREGELKFEESSVMVFDCAQCKRLTPHFIEIGKPQCFEWADSVGELDPNWNVLVGYETRPHPKLLHYTMGVPAYKECRFYDASIWHQYRQNAENTPSWIEIMGGSVHMPKVLERLKCS